MTSARLHLHDTPQRYGSVSRALHWGMALVLTWQFMSAFAHWLLEDTAVEQFLWGTHKTVGTLLLLLVLMRAGWSWHNRGCRPPSLNLMAQLGHLALYVLMVVIPVIALLRQFGSGRAFEPLGVPLMPGFQGDKIEWLTAPANALHSWLGWALLAMIVGHVVMVFVHRRRPGDADVLARMVGDRRR